MGNGSFGRCRSCGRQILWIKTTAGKNMPVDTTYIDYKLPKEGEKATEKIVTPTGEVISANRSDGDNADGYGYISHFATCPNAAQHRRR